MNRILYPFSIKYLYCLAIILLIPALLINLGLLAFIDDEAIRSLVALEMDLSGNFIVPTMHGAFYYNKPPLFNWILFSFFSTFGKYNEFIARFPTTIALLGYGLTIFYAFKKHFSTHAAFLVAFVFITCGRILFWDSLLALIDITFSWVIFLLFMAIYHNYQNKKFYQLFVLSYLLTAVGFMLKGLPAVVFQGVTLLTYFIYQRNFKKLFHVGHFIGGFLFLLIIGSYYWLYLQYNTIDQLIPTLFSESSKRTIVHFGVVETILHFFAFPFEMTYHFLPWSLLIVYLFHRKSIGWIKSHPFIIFIVLTFLSNILIYWTSPEVYPRYLLMLAPLIFGVFIFLHEKHTEANSKIYFFLNRLFFFVMALISLASLAPIFMGITQDVNNLYLKSLLLFSGLMLSTIGYFFNREYAFTFLIVFLIIFRIGFNWFVLPDRNKNDFGDLCRASSIQVGQKFSNQQLYVYGETQMQPTNSYYLTNASKKIIPFQATNIDSEAFYIIDPGIYPNLKYEKVDSIYVRHGQLIYYIGKFKQEK